MSCITENLLEVVYTYPVLYDLNHKDYKNIRKKDKIWEDIGKTLNTSAPEIEGDNTNHDEFVDEPDEVVDDGASPSEPAAKRRKPMSPGSNVDKVIQYLEGGNKPVLDATDHLMLGYSETTKTFTRASQADVKFKIAQIINQAELEQIQEENLSRPGSSSTGSWVDSGINCLTETVLEDQKSRLYDRFANL
ncbi:hypothetical protein J6590_074277 [Homalodisca vitripennis]|nr:hypothetical protein J6590_074277 [Homalodisca vitripennis]